jgi:DNA-binding transcriptional ArsR family regulator
MPDWDKVGFVLASEIRLRILKDLDGGQRVPRDLADALGKNLSHVSRSLHELENQRLVECLTPDRHKGRLYGITRNGKDVLAAIAEMGSPRGG